MSANAIRPRRLSAEEVAGLEHLQVTTGPFEMMTPAGFLADEGVLGSLAFMGSALSRLAYLKKLAWLMPRMQRAVPYLGYLVVAGIRRIGVAASP